MDSFQHAQPAHNRTSQLTRLYSDVKKSADTNLSVSQPADHVSTEFQHKFRIQRDRLITWGLAWSDDEKGGDGNIDDSVARAGLTETVDSVLRNIKDVTEESERVRLGTVPASSGDKIALRVVGFDQARYEDLLRDLTNSIDLLYDLSMSRRALARGEHPEFGPNYVPPPEKGGSGKASMARDWSVAASERTLVNPPPFSRPSLSPYAGLPPRIDVSALRLPAESPPPYESNGVPSTTRLVAHLLRPMVSETVQNMTGSNAAQVPVLIEYANFDSIYRDTHVPPPLKRLEDISMFLQPMRPESQTNLSLLGYFEDPNQPRIGVVYDIPYVIQNRLQAMSPSMNHNVSPVSLLKTLQKARQTTNMNDENAAPALESRYQLALRLTDRLRELHRQNIYHGNVNSSSVLFTTASGESALRQNHMQTALWTSFDLFSKCSVEGITLDDIFNIYRHPLDAPKDDSRSLITDIRFDLYGLALVLLEIGLWLPIGELYKPKYTIADFKLRIERLWVPKLAAKCGSAYMRAVQACIRVADDPLSSAESINALYEQLLERLRRCCLLDEEDSLADLSPPAQGFAKLTQPNAQHQSMPTLPPTYEPPPPSVSMASTRFSADDAHSVSVREGTRGERKHKRLQKRAERRAERTHRTERGRQRAMVDSASIVSPNAPEYDMKPEYPEYARVPQAEPLGVNSFQGTTVPSFREYKMKVITLQRWWRTYLKHQAELLAYHAQMKQQQDAKPAKVVGTSRPVRKEFPQIALPPALLEDWQNRLAFQLADLVAKALKGSPESSSIAFTAYGETPESARPTLLVCCKSTAKVKHALKRHFRYDADLFDVRVKKDEIRRCRKRGPFGSTGDILRCMARESDLARAANPDYQSRPVCGASIGAFRDEEHLPPVSFGGIVLVDGKPYGMSVHHMLEVDDDREGGTREEDAEDDDDEDSDDDSDSSSIRSFDDVSDIASEDNSTVRPPSTIADDDEEEFREGDMPGITPQDFEEILITQPALDDAIDLNLHVDETDSDDEDSGIDEDHLLSYKLGQIYATSGLKRTARATPMKEGFRSISQSLPQEIDWALFDLVATRVHPYNVIRGGAKYHSGGSRRNEDCYPVGIRSSSSLACAKVHCLGRTSGLQAGVVSSTMELVKIHGRSTFSASWSIDGAFGVGGDSGAWVIGNDDGRVCGHVLASRRGKTYICPMDLLLADIKETLGAKTVELPPLAMRSFSGRQSARERSIRKGMEGLRVVEVEAGGVNLPVSPPDSPVMRPVGHQKFLVQREVSSVV